MRSDSVIVKLIESGKIHNRRLLKERKLNNGI